MLVAATSKNAGDDLKTMGWPTRPPIYVSRLFVLVKSF